MKHIIDRYKRTFTRIAGLILMLVIQIESKALSDMGKSLSHWNPEQIDSGLVIGDSLPSWFWDVQLTLIHHPSNDSIFRMADYKDRLLVLDFWGAYCSPCIASIDKWDELKMQFGDAVEVIGIHLFYPNRLAAPFAQKRRWQLPISVDNIVDSALNELFYAQHRFGQVWIKDGKLLAIPKNKAVTQELVGAVVNGEDVDIPMEYSMTYFEHLDPMRISDKQD